jgi:uncharacterized YccA/Bax inhibitor family protein
MANRFSESSNPLIGDAALKRTRSKAEMESLGTMTVQGAVDKSLLLFFILACTGAIGWSYPHPILIWGGAIVGFILVMVSVFNPKRSNILAPLYAVCEGLFVGGISYMYASMVDGIIFKAVTMTLAMIFLMLFIYKSGLIKVTKSFRMGIVMATGAVFILYLVNIVLGLFGINMPFLHEASPLGIGISVVIIGIAALNLLLDFDNFEKGEAMQMPKYFEWFFAMGLLVTVVWLYLEILRLLAMLNRD